MAYTQHSIYICFDEIRVEPPYWNLFSGFLLSSIFIGFWYFVRFHIFDSLYFSDAEFKGIYEFSKKDFIYVLFNEESTHFSGEEFAQGRLQRYSMIGRACKVSVFLQVSYYGYIYRLLTIANDVPVPCTIHVPICIARFSSIFQTTLETTLAPTPNITWKIASIRRVIIITVSSEHVWMCKWICSCEISYRVIERPCSPIVLISQQSFLFPYYLFSLGSFSMIFCNIWIMCHRYVGAASCWSRSPYSLCNIFSSEFGWLPVNPGYCVIRFSQIEPDPVKQA